MCFRHSSHVTGKVTLRGGKFWSDSDYIGTTEDGVISEIVKREIPEQGSQEEGARARQMKVSSL